MNTLDIWLGALPTEANKMSLYASLLDANERNKADSINNPMIRDRYIAVRGLLRITLAQYLGAEPATLEFATAEYGKPYLPDRAWYFNLSHSEDYLALVVADTDGLGIDVERIRSRQSLQDIAKRCFSEAEFNSWNNLPECRQELAFYRIWTKKEAFVKAVGRGLALGLELCELEMPEGQYFLNIPADYGLPRDWRIMELKPDGNFCGALVIPSNDFNIRELTFED